MNPRRFSTFVVARSRLPLAMPKPDDVLTRIVAPHREAARAVARNLYPGLDVVVLDSRAWPIETAEAGGKSLHPELVEPVENRAARPVATASHAEGQDPTSRSDDVGQARRAGVVAIPPHRGGR